MDGRDTPGFVPIRKSYVIDMRGVAAISISRVVPIRIQGLEVRGRESESARSGEETFRIGVRLSSKYNAIL